MFGHEANNVLLKYDTHNVWGGKIWLRTKQTLGSSPTAPFGLRSLLFADASHAHLVIRKYDRPLTFTNWLDLKPHRENMCNMPLFHLSLQFLKPQGREKCLDLYRQSSK